MKSELFVINSIKFSEQAFSAVAELIPSLDVRDLLKTLQNSERLRLTSKNLGVEHQAVFAHLERAIVAAFNRRAVVHLTREHLQLLLNPDVQHALSELLGCVPNSALQTLFSVQSLQETLEYLCEGNIPSLGSNAAQLLSEISKPNRVQQLELDYVTTENDWEPIVDGEQWLFPSATETLMKAFAFGGRVTPSRALAEFINKTLADKSETEGVDLGRSDVLRPLGLIELRRRLSWLRENLGKEIIECGEQAAMSMPGSPCVQMLLPVLQMYEFGNIAQGLKNYINQGHTLKALLPANGVTPHDVDPDRVVQDRALIISGQSKYEVAGDQVWAFDISCSLSDQRQPQTILHVTDVKAWVFHQLSHDLPRLTPSELSPGGDQLHERLLNTSFPLLDPQTERLREVINKLDLAFIQALVLCCEKPIDRIPDLFRGELSLRLPYKELPSIKDPFYPKEVEDIIALHKTTYRNSLRIERGNEVSDPPTQLS